MVRVFISGCQHRISRVPTAIHLRQARKSPTSALIVKEDPVSAGYAHGWHLVPCTPSSRLTLSSCEQDTSLFSFNWYLVDWYLVRAEQFHEKLSISIANFGDVVLKFSH